MTAQSNYIRDTHASPTGNRILDASLASFLKREEAQRPAFVVDDFLFERSVALIAAKSGSGKTMLAIKLGLSVASGGRFVDLKTRKGPVLYIGKDSPAWDYAEIARKHLAGDDAPKNFYIWTRETFRLDDRDAVGAFLKDAISVQPRLITIDSLITVHEQEENDNTDMQKAMDGAREISEATGACVAILHHTGKPREEGKAGDSRGASAIPAAVDFHIFLSAKDEKRSAGGNGWRDVTLEFHKGRCATIPATLELRVEWSDTQASISRSRGARNLSRVEAGLGEEDRRIVEMAKSGPIGVANVAALYSEGRTQDAARKHAQRKLTDLSERKFLAERPGRKVNEPKLHVVSDMLDMSNAPSKPAEVVAPQSLDAGQAT